MKILVADDHKTIVDGIILDLRDILPDAEIVGAFKMKDIAKGVLEKHPRTNIIYITGYEKYAVESYETNASTFLLKPITRKALEKALNNLRFPISDISEEMLHAEFSGKGYIGKRIQYYRELRGISRNELAELLNVTPPTVHRWETGVRIPDLATTI